MSNSGPARAAACRDRWPASASSTRVPTTGLTVYGSDQGEAALFRELAPRFGVRPTITDDPLSEENVGLAAGNRCVSVGHKTHVTRATLRALGRAGVEYVSTRSTGCNHIDVEYARRIGLRVGTTTYSPDGVADFTVMLILMALRDARSVIVRADHQDFRLGPKRGMELRDLTVGVVGTGRIGSAVIARLHGFGCHVLAHDPRVRPAAEHVALDQLLERSDVITLHTPLTEETHHLLDRRRISRMRHGAVVVNTGRGALLDTRALVSALESGRLGGAALDVLEGEDGIFYADHGGRRVANEPLVRLQRLPNVLISPHTAYYTQRALADTVENTLVNCLRFEREDHHD